MKFDEAFKEMIDGKICQSNHSENMYKMLKFTFFENDALTKTNFQILVWKKDIWKKVGYILSSEILNEWTVEPGEVK